MNLEIGKVLTSKSVGTGPSPYEKRIYRDAISESLRNTGLNYLKERRYLLDFSTVLHRYIRMAWIGFMSLRVRTGSGGFVERVMNLWVP